MEQKDLKQLATDIQELISRLPDKPTAGFNTNIVGPFQEAVDELRVRVANLEKAREPDSYFDPSDPKLFGIFAALAMVGQERVLLSQIDKVRFFGSGVYALYYNGRFDSYEPLSKSEHPIYVGKSSPTLAHARNAKQQGDKLWGRIREHRKSIDSATNLNSSDFACRFLVVHTGWETGAEAALMKLFCPIWNGETKVCFGIGKHGDSARTRGNKRSPWDTMHPGRPWAAQSSEDQVPESELRRRVSEHFVNSPVIQGTADILHQLVHEIRSR